MTEPTTTTASMFNWEAAWTVAKTEAEKQFLLDNRARLESLTQGIVDEILALFAAGKIRDGLNKFYGESTDLDTIAAGARQDVVNAASFAAKAVNVREWFNKGSIWVATFLLNILVAGFLGI